MGPAIGIAILAIIVGFLSLGNTELEEKIRHQNK